MLEHTEPLPAKLRILMADDHEMIRHGVRRLIEMQPNWEVCGEASNGREAVALAQETMPDVVVLDIRMPELNGLEAARQIKEAIPTAELLVFSADESEELIHDAFEAGASSFVSKGDLSEHLISAIKALACHHHYFTSRASEGIFARYIAGNTGGTENREDLTAKEREIVRLVSEGKSSAEVGEIVGDSLHAVQVQRAAIICEHLKCQPGEILEYRPDTPKIEK